MTELVEILRVLETPRDGAGNAALATVVSTRGSTYRGPGARLLITDDGLVGTISGGCLEPEIERVARTVMADGAPRLVGFDLTADDEAVWGWGLGCNGAMEVFVEPAADAAALVDVLRRAAERREPLAVATVLDPAPPDVAPGDRIVVGPGGPREATAADAAHAPLARRAAAALDAGRSSVERVDVGDASVRAFVEVLRPRLRLLVCGAGHDAVPLVAAASRLGWEPVVVDDRDAFLTPERFPEAAGFVPVERPAHAAAAAGIDRWTAVTVMTHNYLRDRDYLRSFWGSGAAYVGVLGPRARTERLLEELRAEGAAPSDDDLAKLHGPAGLDVGAEGPEEIAVAVLAEILAVVHGRGGGPLRERAGPIHDRGEGAPAVGAPSR